jgi:hypothetical protein
MSTISVDSEGILRWDRCHWKLYEILVPTIYRMSKSDSVCGRASILVKLGSEIRGGVEVELDMDSSLVWTS